MSNRLRGNVLDRFLNYKKECKLSNIHYGKKAIENMAKVYYPEDTKGREKWIKNILRFAWVTQPGGIDRKDKQALNDYKTKNNAVYFIFDCSKKPPGAGKRWKPHKGHRFLAPNSDIGERIESSRKRTSRKPVRSRTRRRKRTTRRKKVQSGGGLPLCIPCMNFAPAMLAGAAATAAGAVKIGKTYLSRSSSSYRQKGDKESIKKQEEYSMNINGKITKIKFRLKDKKVYKNKKLVGKGKTIEEAMEIYNNLIKECVEKGFDKC